MNSFLKSLLVFVLLTAAGFSADLAADGFAETKKKAAEQGFASAQSNLGNMYYNGEGISKDLVQAHVWWNIAASNGQKNARENLAMVEKQMTFEQKAEAMYSARAIRKAAEGKVVRPTR